MTTMGAFFVISIVNSAGSIDANKGTGLGQCRQEDFGGHFVDDTFPHKGRGWMRVGWGLGAPAVTVMVSFAKKSVDVTAIYK